VEIAKDQLESPDGYASAIEYLLGRVNYEKSGHRPYSINHYKLDRMSTLLAILGNPQQRLPTVHIAGTKGKGSTATIIAEIARAAGYRVGLFTSPHFLHIEERFTVDGAFCPPSVLVKLVERLREAEELLERQCGERLTFFELSTALAWLFFEYSQVDLVVLEVGLGGRLDSTNVCAPLLTIITSISMDHQAQLGDTIAQIASEKAGIIKTQIPVICGARHPDAIAAIHATANANNAPYRQIEIDFRAEWRCQAPKETSDSSAHLPRLPSEIDYHEPHSSLSLLQVELGMPGRHQRDNAAMAIAAANWMQELGWRINESHVRQGVRKSLARGRFELVGCRPFRIVDTAHNEASIHSLIEAMDDYFAGRRRVLLFAASRDKDIRTMLASLIAAVDVLVLTQYRENPRAAQISQLQEIVSEITQSPEFQTRKKLIAHTITAKDPDEAWEMGLQLCGPDDLLCATGSFFFAAELFPRIGLRRFERLTENYPSPDAEA